MQNNELDKEVLEGEAVEIDMTLPDVEDTEDGGAVLRFEEVEACEKSMHFANIVEEVDKKTLADIASELLDKIAKDAKSREKRDELYADGIRRTGLGGDAPGGAKFEGANKVVHPLLVEASVDFSARVMKEIFPPTGPVKSKIYGVQDRAKVEKAQRKAEFMNWQLTQQMVEFRSELEQLSTQLPLGGVQYMKFSWNGKTNRVCSEFVAVDDVFVPFSATNFRTASRKTHRQYIDASEYKRRVDSGMYADVDLPPADGEVETSKASQANDKVEGRQKVSYDEDGLRIVYEVAVDLAVEEGVDSAPYLISIDESSKKVLALYRNWEEQDENREALVWMVEFPFIPWRGAYPIGLSHMIGSISGAATGALRALLDSAHIQNAMTLLKLKGGANGQNVTIQPTEMVELEGGALVDDIRKLVMAVPYNPPSPVLFQLLGFLVDAGKGVVQTTFEKLSDQNPNQPVGTTMALIEQGMVVFSSIHARLHASMEQCFKVIHRINGDNLTEEIIARQSPDFEIKPEDFDCEVDVVPVSDPAIFSETQRFAQVQAIMQRAALAPQLYDDRKVEEMFLRTLKVPKDEVLRADPTEENRDPVSENVAAAMGQPVYVLPKQDHLAHLKTHLAFLKSPLFGENTAIMKTLIYPMAIHLRDHLLNYYLVESHRSVQRLQAEQMLSDDANAEAAVITSVQGLIEQQMAGFAAELQRIDELAQQFKPEVPMQQDNSLQIAQMNASLKQVALEQQDQKTNMLLADKEKDRSVEVALEQMKQEQENARKAEELAARERMNTSDNETAKLLGAAEMATGQRVALSTGTGINPTP